jgi:MoaA/NifB/PqqE/SkfB family radical SAM enzyme
MSGAHRTTPALLRDARMWASRALNRSLAPPDWLSVNLTLRCNLSCVMCTTCYDAPELETHEILDLVDQAAAMGVRVFNPLGGEPFVRPDLERILTHAARRDLFTTLTTNATLIRPERAARIAAVPPQKLHVNVSLDGLDSDHDAVRGQGAFARAMAGYRALRAADEAAGNPVRTIRANVILHRRNLARFEELLAFLESEGFSGVQVLNLFRDEKDPTVGGLWFDSASLPALEALTLRLADARARGEGPAARIINPPDALRLIPRYYREGVQPLDAPCWAGWKELYINADGRAVMCDGTLDFLAGAFGDARRRTLRELWASPELAARRRVVKQCRTPCIQECYLRRDSDALAPIAAGLAQNAMAPARAAAGRIAARLRPPSVLDGTLVLELSDVPTGASPARDALFRASPVPADAVLAEPGRLREVVARGQLDFGRGFMGVELLARILDGLDASGVRFASIALGWRGEPLWHPELGRVLERVRRTRLPIVLWTDGSLAREGRGPLGDTLEGVRVCRPDLDTMGPAVTWDARLVASARDVRQTRVLGNVWEEDVEEVVRRWSGSVRSVPGR